MVESTTSGFAVAGGFAQNFSQGPPGGQPGQGAPHGGMGAGGGKPRGPQDFSKVCMFISKATGCTNKNCKF